MITKRWLSLLLTLTLLITPFQSVLAQANGSSAQQTGMETKSGNITKLINSTAQTQTLSAGETQTGLSSQAWGSMQEQMRLAQYQFTWQTQDGVWAYRAPNPANNLALAFGHDGLMATRYAQDDQPSGQSAGQPSWQFGLRLAAYGGQAMPAAIPAQGLTAERVRVEYTWNEQVTEWFENTPAGLKHGLTLHTPPTAGAVQLDFALSGSLRAELDENNGLLLRTTDGKAVLRYDQLAVYDHNGKPLTAQIMLIPGGLRLAIDANGAVYPLKVDPLLHTETVILRASDAQADDLFGYSAAVSGDVIVIGAYAEDGSGAEAGATYVFQRQKNNPDAWGQVQKLSASDAQAGDYFGYSVAVSGDVIVVGAYLEDGASTDAGAAYVFQRQKNGADAWGQVKKLSASDTQASDLFGRSVAVSGDVIVVGAIYEDGGAGNPLSNAGAAYVFQRQQGGTDTWGQVKKLSASDAQVEDVFGWSVAISGDVIVVGAPWKDDGGSEAGAAYIFQRQQGGTDTWGQVKRLSASDAQAQDHFGYSVAVSGNVVAVGAPLEDGGTGDPLSDAGAAYVFQRQQGGTDTWDQVQKLSASEAQASDYFGYSVASSEDVIVVGAPYEDSGGSNAGAAYAFQRSNNAPWREQAIRHASDAQADDNFGHSVAVSGDVLVIGASGEDGGSGNPLSNAGAAYVFQRMKNGADGWGQVKILRASDAQAEDSFGMSVAISGDVIAVGAHLEDGGTGDPLTNTGAAYIFQRMQGGIDNWGQVKILHASDALAGYVFGYSIAASGDVIVVGAPSANSVYVFQRMQGGAGNWGQAKILHASDAQPGALFGYSVGVSGDVIAVGAKGQDDDCGAAYVFQRMQGGIDNWGQVKRLVISASIWARIGESVAVSGDVIVVGAPCESTYRTYDGAAHVFQRMHGGVDNWGEVRKLVISGLPAYSQLGISVAISGDVIVVGGPVLNSAYVAQRRQGGADGWGWLQALSASDAQGDDQFGSSVAISGDVIVVGAQTEDGGAGEPAGNAGAAYIFRPDTPPVAVDDGGSTYTTDEATGFDFAVSSMLANDTDPDGDAISLNSFDPSGMLGWLYYNGSDTFSYDPNGQFEALGVGEQAFETFVYNATDGLQSSNSAVVTITIHGLNDAPIAVDDQGAGFTTDETTALTIGNVLANDSDIDGDTLSVSGFKASGLLGLLTSNGDGTFNYDPNGQFEALGAGEQAFETFVYTATDGLLSNSAVVAIAINGVNDLPIAVDDQGAGFAANEDTSLTTGNVLNNDTDIDGDTLSMGSFDASGLPGLLTSNSDGTFDYDPNGQFEAMGIGEQVFETFVYTVTDGLAYNSAVVTITVSGLNDAPVAVDDHGAAFTTDEDSGFTLGDMLGNDSDIEGDTLSINSLDATGLLGALVDNGNGTFVYSPDSQFETLGVGEQAFETFVYTVTDGLAYDSATVTITVNGVNDAPVADDDAYTLSAASSLDVLAGDTDIDGDMLQIYAVGMPNHGGTAVISGTLILYTPAAGFTGVEIFTYTISDGHGGFDTATVTVLVLAKIYLPLILTP